MLKPLSGRSLEESVHLQNFVRFAIGEPSDRTQEAKSVAGHQADEVEEQYFALVHRSQRRFKHYVVDPLQGLDAAEQDFRLIALDVEL